MSDLESKLADVASIAKAQGLDIPQVVPLLLNAWNAKPVEEFADNGMSAPVNGFVRFAQLEKQRAEYEAAGQRAAAAQLAYSYACFPGAKACEPNSMEQYQAATNVSNATMFLGMGLGDWFNVHPAKRYEDALGNPYFRLDYSVTLADVFPIPHLEKGTGKEINRTPEECIAYMLANAAQFVVRT